jgi:hypothetical protein
MAIPRRLIQVQIDFSGMGRAVPLSPLAQASMANLQLLHPDWEYLFFDDAAVDRFITTEFPEHRSVFDAFREPIQRVDFFRYLAIYRLGGFYFDLDVLLSKPLDDLVQHECVFAFEDLNWNQFLRTRYGVDWNVGNYGFGAAAGAPFLNAVIENCCRAVRDGTWLEPMMKGINFLLRPDYYILNSTGPGLVTRTLAENSPGIAADVHVLFPRDVRDQKDWHLFGEYGVHLMNAGWRKSSYLRSRLASRWEAFVWNRAVARSIPRGPFRSLGAPMGQTV